MEVNEALSIQQRIKRANIAHRNAPKLERARERAARKLAPESNIKRRAYALARKILRKRVAGGRGAVYQELGPTEKISIDKQLDNKKALIKKIALRLIPKIRQSEQHRLQSFLKGKAMKNDAINEAFEKKFKKTKKKTDSYIKFFNKFTEEKQNNTSAYRSLLKKSEKHGVDVEAIGDIYNEAFNDFDNVETNLTPEQYAFSRVNHELNELSKQTYTNYINASYKARNKEFLGSANRIKIKKREKGIITADKLRNKKVDEQTAYSQQELGKHVKTYKNVRGSKYDLYKNLNGHKLVNRISGASEDYPHQNTRELHKKLLKTLLPEETQLDEVSPSRASSPNFRDAQHNLNQLKKGIKPVIHKAPTWKQHMASYDKEEKARYHEHKKHYEYHKAELKDLHKTYKDLHSGNLGIHKDDKVGQHGAEEEIESMKDKHRAKIEYHLNKMHYHNNNLSKPLKIKESLDEETLDELSVKTLQSYKDNSEHRPIKHWLLAHNKIRKANKAKDFDAPNGYTTTEGPKVAASKPIKPKPERKRNLRIWDSIEVPEGETLNETKYIVSGRHQDQGYSKTKIYKADSEEHARKQFHDEHEDFHAFKIKKLTLNKLKNEEHDKCGTPECCGKCESLDEFVVTASLLAGMAAAKKAKSAAPKAARYVKNQAFSQVNHLKDKVASIVSKREDTSRMTTSQYLKRKEAQIKEELDSQAERIKKLNNKTRRQVASNKKKIEKNKPVNEVLGVENQIGTKGLVKKLQKLTPGQEKAQVNENTNKVPYLHYGVVMLHRANKEHKVIKFSEPHPASLQNQTTGKWNLPHSNYINRVIGYHDKVKEHKAKGWEVDHGVVSHQKANVIQSVKGHLDGHAFRKFTLKEEIDLDEACWKGYKQLGMKKKGEKTVPNCVKESDEQNFRKQHSLEKANKSIRQNVWGSHVGYIGKKRYTTFPDKIAAKEWLGEDVKSAETKGVVVPSYIDANGNTIPAKTVQRKVGNKIVKSGDVHDGK